MADEPRKYVGAFCKFCGWQRIADKDLYTDDMGARLMALYEAHLTAHVDAAVRHFEFTAGD